MRMPHGVIESECAGHQRDREERLRDEAAASSTDTTATVALGAAMDCAKQQAPTQLHVPSASCDAPPCECVCVTTGVISGMSVIADMSSAGAAWVA